MPEEPFRDFLRFHQGLPEGILLEFFGFSRQIRIKLPPENLEP